jgi:hypothetical protein
MLPLFSEISFAPITATDPTAASVAETDTELGSNCHCRNASGLQSATIEIDFNAIILTCTQCNNEIHPGYYGDSEVYMSPTPCTFSYEQETVDCGELINYWIQVDIDKRKTTDMLPPFSGLETNCPKCTATHIKAELRKKADFVLAKAFGNNLDHLPDEWLSRTCPTCNHVWREHTADHKKEEKCLPKKQPKIKTVMLDNSEAKFIPHTPITPASPREETGN